MLKHKAVQMIKSDRRYIAMPIAMLIAMLTLQRKKKREVICLMLVLALAVSLAGCGKKLQQADSDAVTVGVGGLEEAENFGSEAEEAGTESGNGKGISGESEESRMSPEEENGSAGETEAEQAVTAGAGVKGIFVTGQMAGTSNMENLIGLVERTELNAIVLDVKNDEGRITWNMQIPAVEEIGSGINYIRNIEELVEECREKDIYLIARMVAFKDPFLAEARPEWCVHNKDGSIFRDKGGLAWLNPYNQEVWEYLLDIAEEAIELGFDEVQFDYIRFSTDSGMKNADFGSESEKDRQKVITDFVKYAADRIHSAGGVISADVYGMVIDSEVDQQIVGQNYMEMSRYLDYISPMVYPSHYGPYNYNIPVPDAEPYRLVLTAMQSSRKVLAGIPVNTVSGNEIPEYTDEEIAALPPVRGVRAQVRPWLQDFTATWVKGHISYGAEQIRDQIQAVYDGGYEGWILWNAANRYTEDGLLSEDDALSRESAQSRGAQTQANGDASIKEKEE